MADYLRLEGIRKSFGSFQALKDIDLAIAQGEFVCFLGPSGCGKTTLLRIIAGLETQTGGSTEMSRSPWWMLPAVRVSSPAMMRSKVVMPQPDGPRKLTNSPFSIDS